MTQPISDITTESLLEGGCTKDQIIKIKQLELLERIAVALEEKP